MTEKTLSKVIRLHGELYERLSGEAERLGIKPGALAGYIIEKAAQQNEKDSTAQAGQGRAQKTSLHPLTEAYLPTHNPRPSQSERTRKIKITVSSQAFNFLQEAAQKKAGESGIAKPAEFDEYIKTPQNKRRQAENYPACRNYFTAFAAAQKRIIISLLLEYLEQAQAQHC